MKKASIAIACMALEAVSYLITFGVGIAFSQAAPLALVSAMVFIGVIAWVIAWYKIRVVGRLSHENATLTQERDRAYDIAGREQHARRMAVDWLARKSEQLAESFNGAYRLGQRNWATQDRQKRLIAGRLLTLTADRIERKGHDEHRP